MSGEGRLRASPPPRPRRRRQCLHRSRMPALAASPLERGGEQPASEDAAYALHGGVAGTRLTEAGMPRQWTACVPRRGAPSDSTACSRFARHPAPALTTCYAGRRLPDYRFQSRLEPSSPAIGRHTRHCVRFLEKYTRKQPIYRLTSCHLARSLTGERHSATECL